MNYFGELETSAVLQVRTGEHSLFS